MISWEQKVSFRSLKKTKVKPINEVMNSSSGRWAVTHRLPADVWRDGSRLCPGREVNSRNMERQVSIVGLLAGLLGLIRHLKARVYLQLGRLVVVDASVTLNGTDKSA